LSQVVRDKLEVGNVFVEIGLLSEYGFSLGLVVPCKPTSFVEILPISISEDFFLA
jgi:hypothetical protein